MENYELNTNIKVTKEQREVRKDWDGKCRRRNNEELRRDEGEER